MRINLYYIKNLKYLEKFYRLSDRDKCKHMHYKKIKLKYKHLSP